MIRRKPKFGSNKVKVAGIWFSSKLEASIHSLLLLRERAGEIKDIKCQSRVRFHTFDYGWVIMIPDFRVWDIQAERFLFIEAKGFETREWVRKRKAWLQGGPGNMEVWKGTHARPFLKEVLIPRKPEENNS